MRAALLLPCVFALAAASGPIARHGGHDDDMMDSEMMGEMPEGVTSMAPVSMAPPPRPFGTMTKAAEPSPTPGSDDHHDSHDAAPHHDDHHDEAPPDPHGHHSHAPVKEFLNDTDIHRWHKFPPTYLDADFRLTQDSVIFGEELPADWPGETPSHPGLMILHVAAMCVAYFGALPVGEYCSRQALSGLGDVSGMEGSGGGIALIRITLGAGGEGLECPFHTSVHVHGRDRLSSVLHDSSAVLRRRPVGIEGDYYNDALWPQRKRKFRTRSLKHFPCPASRPAEPILPGCNIANEQLSRSALRDIRATSW